MGMGYLLCIQGPESGKSFPLAEDTTTLGRQHDCDVCLPSQAVSRHHAQIVHQDPEYYVVDLESSNGSFLNSNKITPMEPQRLADGDQLRFGPHVFIIKLKAPETQYTVRETVSATSSVAHGMLGPDAAAKLQTILDIAQQLARNLDVNQLLENLLAQLMRLFPQTDRALAILCEGPNLQVRAQSCRHLTDASTLGFSKTIVKRALDEGIGLISEDIKQDERFQSSATLTSLDMISIMCMPLITPEGKRLGVLQVDRRTKGHGYHKEDLSLLSAVAAQMTVVLENATLHAERLKQEALRKELTLAREIQQGFLPKELSGPPLVGLELFGQVFPARQVAGDLYDYFYLPDGKVALFLGDVSGKGMPAALFMIAVRTLCRLLARESTSPGQTLTRLNDALADDNPTCIFVTLLHGIYDPATRELVLASGGHPAPLLRRSDGSIETVPLVGGRLLGYPGKVKVPELKLTLEHGDLLVAFTDGVFEARQKKVGMFGLDRFKDVVRMLNPLVPLDRCGSLIREQVQSFTGLQELQDDLTVLLLRQK